MYSKFYSVISLLDKQPNIQTTYNMMLVVLLVLTYIDVGSVGGNLELHAASIFRVELCRVGIYLCMFCF
jgi:hypothetical protein